MKTNRFYSKHLNAYFDKHYGEYEDIVEWYTDPVSNKWIFDIPDQKLRVKLTCNDDGVIEERRFYIHKF